MMGIVKTGIWLMVVLSLPALAETYINTASIFELGVSARAVGMGGAFIAVADDDAAVFYNPAGLPHLASTLFSSLFTRPFGAYSYGVLSAAEPTRGAQFLFLDSDTLEKRDLYGNTIGMFRYTETGGVLGFGFHADARFSLGIQVKLYALALPTQGAGASLSLAVLFEEESHRFGMVWRNVVNTGLRFADGYAEPWMRDLAVGFAWRADTTLYAIDFTEHLFTRGDVSCVRMGVEDTRFYPIVLRAGTNREWTSFGFSVHWQEFRFDLAYVLHYALPPSYFLAVSYKSL